MVQLQMSAKGTDFIRKNEKQQKKRSAHQITTGYKQVFWFSLQETAELM